MNIDFSFLESPCDSLSRFQSHINVKTEQKKQQAWWQYIEYIIKARLQGRLNEELLLVVTSTTVCEQKRVFQSLTAAVNILPEMCQKNPNFRSPLG